MIRCSNLASGTLSAMCPVSAVKPVPAAFITGSEKGSTCASCTMVS